MKKKVKKCVKNRNIHADTKTKKIKEKAMVMKK
jgi:hypothetical protein